MDLSLEIRREYGVRIGDIPNDGCMYSFKIDPFRIGFVVSLGDCAAFGCWSHRELFVVVEAGVIPVRMDGVADSSAVQSERRIIAVGRALHQKNGGLTVEENERLQQAVRFVEARS